VGYSLTSQSEVKFSARYIQKKWACRPVSFPDPDDRQEDENTLLNLSYQGQITPQLKLGFEGGTTNTETLLMRGPRESEHGDLGPP
jgi:hypothetical protein